MKKAAWIVCIMAALSFGTYLCVFNFGSQLTPNRPAPNVVSASWSKLAPAGKGVQIVKVNLPNRSDYILIRGTNLALPLSVIIKNGIRFEDIESLQEFLRQKPPEYIITEGSKATVDDDLGSLGEFSRMERERIWGRSG